jgi:hypothetical protein
MVDFWELVVADALAAVGAKHLLEVGADTGACTERLLAYCAAVGGHLDCIDPDPHFDVDLLRARYGAAFTFHRGTSLEALPRIHDLDAALVDGDHNWYTLYHELKLLEAGARARGRGLPLVFLHDVAWPYARRDMYYAPERIPPEHRQPHARLGIIPGQSRLSADVGFNATLANALEEGGPRNGVLTAVEDFLRESPVGASLYVVPGCFGLGVLVSPDHQENQALMARLRFWNTEAGLRTLVGFLEGKRIEQVAEVARLSSHLSAREQDMAVVLRSRSWQLTRPLRAVTRGIRRLRGRRPTPPAAPR